MGKVTTFADIRVGDTVQLMLGEATHRVLAVDRSANLGPYVHLKLSPEPGIEYWRAQPSGTPIILVRRPWQEGKTEQEMLGAVEACARRLAEAIADARAINEGQVGIEHDHRENPQDVLAELRGAIEAYELGKPFDSAQGKPEVAP